MGYDKWNNKTYNEKNNNYQDKNKNRFKCKVENVNIDNYVDMAEKVINNLPKDRDQRIKLTTSQIRNILGMTSDIYNDARFSSEELDDKIRERVQYLKLHVVYAAGRDNIVKDFVDCASIVEFINIIGRSKEKLILFCHYMEALVAYRKYSGNDK